MQLGPDRLPDAITLELAKDVVDGRARRKGVTGQIGPGTAGAQLHDHFNTYLVWRCPQKITVNDMALSPARKLTAAEQYAVSRSGHLSNAGIYAGALVRTDPRLEQPDLQINKSGWSAMERLRIGLKPLPFSAFTFSPVHLRPDGRGWVRIKSPDPLAPPVIQFNFLASAYDFQPLIYGAQLSRKIAAQPALKPFVCEEVLPGPECKSDEQIIEESRARGVSNLNRSAPAGWSARSMRWSIRGCASTVSRGCASPTPR